MHRRDLLTATAATAVTGLAGCLAGGSSDDGGGDGDEPAPAVSSSSIETIATACAGQDAGDASVTLSDGTVTVEGTIGAPDPCHDAVLQNVGVEDDELRVEVGRTAVEGTCTTCTGEIDYRATIQAEDAGGLATCTVDHDGGETYSVGLDQDSDDIPAVSDTAIETTGTECRSGNPGEAAADRGDGTVTVDGVIGASNPCHEAVLQEVAIHNRQLVLTVDVDSRDGPCQKCLGAISYTATVELSGADGLAGVTAEHVGRDEHATNWDDDWEITP